MDEWAILITLETYHRTPLLPCILIPYHIFNQIIDVYGRIWNRTDKNEVIHKVILSLSLFLSHTHPTKSHRYRCSSHSHRSRKSSYTARACRARTRHTRWVGYEQEKERGIVLFRTRVHHDQKNNSDEKTSDLSVRPRLLPRSYCLGSVTQSSMCDPLYATQHNFFQNCIFCVTVLHAYKLTSQRE